MTVMLVASNTLIPKDTVTQRPPAASRDPQRGAGGPRQAEQLFSGIGRWPDFDQVLAERSVKLISERGVSEWALAGGVVLSDGRPSFGSPSVIAYRLLRDIVAAHQGFRFNDSAGVHWVATMPESSLTSGKYWKGLAIGTDFSPVLLERGARRLRLQEAERELRMLVESDRASRSQPGRRRARAAAAYERVKLLDSAVEMIPTIYAASKNQNSQTVRLDATELAHAPNGNEFGGFPAASEKVFAALMLLSTIRTQVIEIPKTGWCPTSRQCGVAVQRIRRLRDKEFSVRSDPVFVRFLDHWLSSDDTQLRPPTLPQLSKPTNEGVLHG